MMRLFLRLACLILVSHFMHTMKIIFSCRLAVSLFCLLLLCAGTGLKAQESTETIPFVAYWNKGDSHQFRVTKTLKQWRQDSLERNERSTYLATFTVMDSTPDSYTVRWTYDAGIFLPPGTDRKGLGEFQKGEVIYRTDELGIFEEILNWEELSAKVGESYSRMANELENQDEEKQVMIDEYRENILSILQSKESIEKIMFKELQVFHMPLGLEYQREDTVRYREELPNLLGGNPIGADAMMYLENVDLENEFCTMVVSMKLDQADVKAMIDQLLQAMVTNSADPKELGEVRIEINDLNRFSYWYYPGIPKKIDTRRESVLAMAGDNRRRLETLSIEIIGDLKSP